MKQGTMIIYWKRSWVCRNANVRCTFCDNHIPIGEEMVPFDLRCAALDDLYVWARDGVLVPQYACRNCRDERPNRFDKADVMRVLQWRCEALLKSGRRCRQVAYVNYDIGFGEDRCAKHRSVERASV